MKLSISFMVLFLACCIIAYKYESPPHHKANMHKGESSVEFRYRIITSRNYSLPGGKCYFDAAGKMEGQHCVLGIDSCCFTEFEWICYPEPGNTEGKGYCLEYHESVDGSRYKYFNHTI